MEAILDNIVSQDQVEVFIMPENKFDTIIDACQQAKSNIYMPIYNICSATTFKIIKDALDRGVNVRIMINGQNFHGTSKSNNSKIYDHMYFIMALRSLETKGKLQVHWSSDNYAISHQKCIIIDMYDKNWQIKNKKQLSSTSSVFIMTGNTYVPNWHNIKKRKNLCARDFIYKILDDDAKIFISEIMMDDFTKHSDEINILQSKIQKSNNGVLLSNGCTNPDNKYPSCGRYNLDAKSFMLYENQGNYLAALQNIISSAEHEILIYNEIITDDNCVSMICEASQRGIQVKIILPTEHQSTTQKSIVKSLSACGIEFAKQKTKYYSHAKAVIVDRKIMISGSHNMSKHSLTYNREISIVTRNLDVINTVSKVFEEDFKHNYSTKLNNNIDCNEPMFALNAYNGKFEGGKEIDIYSIPSKLKPEKVDHEKIKEVTESYEGELIKQKQ